MHYDEYEYLLFDRPSPGLLRVTINRPEKANALPQRGHEELASVWETISQDDDVRAVIVTGAGRAFCTGGDNSSDIDQAGDIQATIRIGETARRIVHNMMQFERPVISAINGAAAGAGLAVALLADVSIVNQEAKLTDAHARIGIAAGDHALLLWPLLCGMAKAKYYLMTADIIDGREAERIGLVTMCVPPDRVMPRALEVAERMARMSQWSLRWTKRCLNHWMLQSAPVFDLSVAYECLGLMHPDAAEGLQAFTERREPRFS